MFYDDLFGRMHLREFSQCGEKFFGDMNRIASLMKIRPLSCRYFVLMDSMNRSFVPRFLPRSCFAP